MKKSILFAFILLITCRLFAQNEIVEDGEMPESELHVAINPLDTNNIIVAVMKSLPYEDTFSRVVVYYTNDYGNTWNQSDFSGKLPNSIASGDPVIAFDNQGRAYLVSLTIDGFNIKSSLSWSDDNGATWQKKPLIDDCDKPWFAIDNNPNSPYLGRKYIPIATADGVRCIVLDANDNQLFLSNPVAGNYSFEQLSSVSVQADGDVYVGYYFEYNNGIFGLNMARSSNGGQSFSPESKVANTSLEVFTSITGIEDRLNLSPYTAIDKSNSPYRNRIYYTYTDNESGPNSPLDIFLTWSDNDGLTWTTPKKVVDDLVSTGSQQFYSSIYVNEIGTLLLGWYDRREDAADKLTDFYLGISYDGGTTINEVKVSSEPSDFSTIGLVNTGFGVGDYGQIIATKNTALPFWSDGRTNDGDMNVYFARIPLGDLPVGVKEISTITDQISMGQPYPIPAVDKISFSLKLKKEGRFVAKLVSADGKIVYTSEQKELLVGENVVFVPISEGLLGSLFLSVEGENGFFRTVKVR
jgi:hypothetical protein